MAIEVLYIGKKSKNLYSEGESEFIKRIKRYSKLDITPIEVNKYSSSLPVIEIQKVESQTILNKLKQATFLSLLDERGKHFDSLQFSKFLENKLAIHSHLSFVIGGAYGFSEDFRNNQSSLISLSSLTFPHHMARLVLLEQIYRAFTIINNEPYHNE